MRRRGRRRRTDLLNVTRRIHQIAGAKLALIVSSLDEQGAADGDRALPLAAGVDQRAAAVVLYHEAVAVDLCHAALHGHDAARLRQPRDRGRHRRRHLDRGARERHRARTTRDTDTEQRGPGEPDLLSAADPRRRHTRHYFLLRCSERITVYPRTAPPRLNLAVQFRFKERT